MEETFKVSVQELTTKFISKVDIYKRLTNDRKKLCYMLNSPIFPSVDEKMSIAFHKRNISWQKRSKSLQRNIVNRYLRYTRSAICMFRSMTSSLWRMFGRLSSRIRWSWNIYRTIMKVSSMKDKTCMLSSRRSIQMRWKI